jgi:TRAP-type mannitol/chloroaromatic compound transport system permease small subunit
MEERALKRILLQIDNVIGKVSEWAILVSGILIVLMGFLTTYGVARRYFFNSPEPYSYEMSVIFLTSCILLAIPHLQWLKRNIRVDFVIAHMSKKGQWIFDSIIPPVLGLVYVAIIVWKSAGVFWVSFQRGETSQAVWQEPLWPMKLLVTLTMCWLVLVLLSQLVQGIVHLRRGSYVEKQLEAEREASEEPVVTEGPEVASQDTQVEQVEASKQIG